MQKRHAVLGHQNPLLLQAGLAVGIEPFLEQRFSGTGGIGRVDDDEVELVLRFGDECDAVGEDKLGAPILERTLGDRRQVAAAILDDIGVDLDDGDAPDVPVLQHLPQRTAVAAADDEDVPDRPMGEEWRVGQHLMVEVFVRFGGLEDAVEDQDPAEGRGVEDHQLLEFGLLAMERPGDFESLSISGVKALKEPLGARQSPFLFRELDRAGSETPPQFGNGPVGIAGAAHENVDGRVSPFRPGVDADMGFGDHRDPGDAALIAETVEVKVEQRGVARRDRSFQGGLHHLGIIEALGAPEVDEQMGAGVAETVFFDEIVVAFPLGLRGPPARRTRGAGRPVFRWFETDDNARISRRFWWRHFTLPRSVIIRRVVSRIPSANSRENVASR